LTCQHFLEASFKSRFGPIVTMTKNLKHFGLGLFLAGLVACMCMISSEGSKATDDAEKMQVTLSSDGDLESSGTEAFDSEPEVQDEKQKPVKCNRPTMKRMKAKIAPTQDAYKKAREDYEKVIAKAEQTMRRAAQAYKNAVASTERHKETAEKAHDAADFAATDAQRLYSLHATACKVEDEANALAEKKRLEGVQAAKFKKAKTKIGNSAVWASMYGTMISEVAMKLQSHCESNGGAAATVSQNADQLAVSVKNFEQALTDVRLGLKGPTDPANTEGFAKVVDATDEVVNSWNGVKGGLTIAQGDCIPPAWYNAIYTTNAEDVANENYKKLVEELRNVKRSMQEFVETTLRSLKTAMQPAR